MQAKQRQEYILEKLHDTNSPISASRFAKDLKVSRQVIVGDIALLRAREHDIIATHRGYVLSDRLLDKTPHYRAKLVCKHGPLEVQKEMEIVIKNGGKLLDVQVEHPMYGTLSAPLNIVSQEDIHFFMDKLSADHSTLLSSLTDGIHIHTISCDSRSRFDKIKQELAQAAILFSEN